MFYICDQTRIDAGPMCNASADGAVHYWSHLHDWYTWSQDNQAEIEKGWIVKADTLEELAEKLGIDPTGLADQVARYNEGCASGEDEFGRDLVLTPVETGPVLRLRDGLGSHQHPGGPVRNEKYQVLNYDDEGHPAPVRPAASSAPCTPAVSGLGQRCRVHLLPVVPVLTPPPRSLGVRLVN